MNRYWKTLAKHTDTYCYAFVKNEQPTNCICVISYSGVIAGALYAIVDTDQCVTPVAMSGPKAKELLPQMEDAMYDHLMQLLKERTIKNSFSMSHNSPLFDKGWDVNTIRESNKMIAEKKEK